MIHRNFEKIIRFFISEICLSWQFLYMNFYVRFNKNLFQNFFMLFHLLLSIIWNMKNINRYSSVSSIHPLPFLLLICMLFRSISMYHLRYTTRWIRWIIALAYFSLHMSNEIFCLHRHLNDHRPPMVHDCSKKAGLKAVRFNTSSCNAANECVLF